MTEESLREIVRDEISRSLDDGGELGEYVRTVALNMLRQLGYAEFVPPPEKQH